MGNSHGGRKRKAIIEHEERGGPRKKRRRFDDLHGDDEREREDHPEDDYLHFEDEEEDHTYTPRYTPEPLDTNTVDGPTRKRRRTLKLGNILPFVAHRHDKDAHYGRRAAEQQNPRSIGDLFQPHFPFRNTASESNFTPMQEIGRGAFGSVFRVVDRRDPYGVFALKVQDKKTIVNKGAVEQVRREVAIQKKLGSYVFVSRLYCCWQCNASLFSLLQLADGGCGDLFTVWRDLGPFPENTIKFFAAELCCVIDYMHRNDVIYRDLKLENIVFDRDGHILLIDFGLAKELTNGQLTRTVCGTLQYMAPEIAHEESYGHWIDWWSMATLLHILFTNRYPYPNGEVFHHTHLRFVDYSPPTNCSFELRSFFDRLLNICVGRRMCCFEVIHSHPFFSNIQWDQVEQRRYSPLGSFPWFQRQRLTSAHGGDSAVSQTDDSLFALFDETSQLGLSEDKRLFLSPDSALKPTVSERHI